MEPVSAHSPTPGALRPALALSQDLGAVLQEGRILSGQVLQLFGGGSILIGIGQHRVPAQSSIEFALGDRVLLEVAERDGRMELILVDEDGERGPDATLIRTVREGLARGRSLAELLARLVRPEGPSGGLPETGPARQLAARLGSATLAREPSGADVARVLERIGNGYESSLLEAVLARSSKARRRELVGGLWAELRDALANEGASASRAGARASTPPAAPGASRTALAQGATELDELVRAALRERLDELGARPGAPEPELARRLGRELEAIVRAVLRRARGAAGGASPRPGEAKPLRWSASPAVREAVVRQLLGWPAGDAEGSVRPASMKLWLLEAIANLPRDEGGGLGELVGRAAARLEADQLLNLVRAEAGEPQHLALPFPDGDRWTTLHFFRHPPRGDGDEGGEEESRRVTIELELAGLGALAADFVLGASALTLGITTPRPDVHERLVAEAPELEERLAALHGRARVVVRLAPELPGGAGGPESTEGLADGELGSVRYLREHPLMDRSA